MKPLLFLTLILVSCAQMERPEKPFIIHDKMIDRIYTSIIRYGAYDSGGKYLYFDGRVGDYQIGDTIP